jgi:hypothetical protein
VSYWVIVWVAVLWSVREVPLMWVKRREMSSMMAVSETLTVGQIE